MKKLTFFIAGMMISSSLTAQLNIYGGIQTQQASSTDFVNFHISDWENYGLLANDPSSLEGRVAVNLTDVEPGFINLGIFVGADYSLSDKLSALGEIQYNLSGISNLGINAGVTYNWTNSEKIRQGLSLRLGYNTGSADLGTVSVIENYTPPVVLTEGTFDDGDALSMEFSGLVIGFGLSTDIKISDKIGLRIEPGYQLGFMSSDGLIAGGVAVPMSSAAVVQPDGQNTQAGILPDISSSGAYIKLGVSYNLDF
jgi:hypothetical protein